MCSPSTSPGLDERHGCCGQSLSLSLSLSLRSFSKKGSTPTPWARGLRDQIQIRARQRQIHSVYSAQRAIRTMVLDMMG